MFDGPEYASYVQLCGELRLEWEWREGDYFVTFYNDQPTFGMVGLFVAGERDYAIPGAVPLPRLDQWYSLIRETWVRGGGPSIDLYGDDVAGFFCETDDRSVLERGEGKTPEEAAARLWAAVTRRETTSRI